MAGLLLRALRCQRCCTRGGPHVYLLLSKDNAGPTNNWVEPFRDAARKLKALFNRCMRGRTMYVLPLQHGTGGLADGANRRAIDRLTLRVVEYAHHGAHWAVTVFQEIDKDDKRVVPCMHSVGAPLAPGTARCSMAVQ